MKYQNKNSTTHCMEGNKKKAYKVTQKYRNHLRRKLIKVNNAGRCESLSSQYAFYTVLNTDLSMDHGTAAAAIACGLILLYTQLEENETAFPYVDRWIKFGRKMIILKGYGQKHLKYLKEEAQFVALGTHMLRQHWSSGSVISVLTLFGQREDLDEIFEGLELLK